MRPSFGRAINSRRALAPLVMCVVVVLLAAFLSPLEAKTRDSDETRMQAREVEFPSRHSDALAPPDDQIDWRYFKLDEQRDCRLEVRFESADAGGTIRLVAAKGDEIAATDASNGEAIVSASLDPGVYYVSVEADEKSSYRLSIGS